MNTVLNAVAALVLCLPLLILAVHEHRTSKAAENTEGEQ